MTNDNVRDQLTLIARDVHLYDGRENAALYGPLAQRIADAILSRFDVKPKDRGEFIDGKLYLDGRLATDAEAADYIWGEPDVTPKEQGDSEYGEPGGASASKIGGRERTAPDMPEGQAPDEHFHIWSRIPCKPGQCRMEQAPADAVLAEEAAIWAEQRSDITGVRDLIREAFLEGATRQAEHQAPADVAALIAEARATILAGGSDSWDEDANLILRLADALARASQPVAKEQEAAAVRALQAHSVAYDGSRWVCRGCTPERYWAEEDIFGTDDEHDRIAVRAILEAARGAGR